MTLASLVLLTAVIWGFVMFTPTHICYHTADGVSCFHTLDACRLEMQAEMSPITAECRYEANPGLR